MTMMRMEMESLQMFTKTRIWLITLQGGDCDDSNPDISPNETEVPCDGLDNNCDNTIDEGSLDATESTGSKCQ